MGIKNKAYDLTGKVIELSLKKYVGINIKDVMLASCTGKTSEIFLIKVDTLKKINR